MNEQRQPHEQAQDYALAIIQAGGAIAYMAGCLSHTANQFAFIAASDKTGTAARELPEQAKALREALAGMERVMNDLGDFLSNHDMVEKHDERATTAAFVRVRALLRPHKDGCAIKAAATEARDV